MENWKNIVLEEEKKLVPRVKNACRILALEKLLDQRIEETSRRVEVLRVRWGKTREETQFAWKDSEYRLLIAKKEWCMSSVNNYDLMMKQKRNSFLLTYLIEEMQYIDTRDNKPKQEKILSYNKIVAIIHFYAPSESGTGKCEARGEAELFKELFQGIVEIKSEEYCIIS